MKILVATVFAGAALAAAATAAAPTLTLAASAPSVVKMPDGRYLMHHPATGRTIGPEEHPPGHNRPAPRPPPDDPHPD